MDHGTDKHLFEMPLRSLSEESFQVGEEVTEALESGRVIYLPKMEFLVHTDEKKLLNEAILMPREKNVSFDIRAQKMNGVHDPSLYLKTEFMMQRFAHFSRELVIRLFPKYQATMTWGRTSYRPAEIEGRASSKRKDDTRIHVDAFPSTPVHGKRILRVFSNINPDGKARVWHLGEPFESLLPQFVESVPRYSAIKARALKWLKATRSFRTGYDHYMLHLHDMMKLDDEYQDKLVKFRFDFPAKSTWIVFTDQVSHAALKGQFLLEQTFYLPVDGMHNPQMSPLRQWESCLESCKIKTPLV